MPRSELDFYSEKCCMQQVAVINSDPRVEHVNRPGADEDDNKRINHRDLRNSSGLLVPVLLHHVDPN